MHTIAPKKLDLMSANELRLEAEAWMDRAVYATTALGEAKDLLRKWRAGHGPDSGDLAVLDLILGPQEEGRR